MVYCIVSSITLRNLSQSTQTAGGVKPWASNQSPFLHVGVIIHAHPLKFMLVYLTSVSHRCPWRQRNWGVSVAHRRRSLAIHKLHVVSWWVFINKIYNLQLGLSRPNWITDINWMSKKFPTLYLLHPVVLKVRNTAVSVGIQSRRVRPLPPALGMLHNMFRPDKYRFNIYFVGIIAVWMFMT